MCIYVDDLLIMESDQTKFGKFKEFFMVEFKMTDLGMLRYFLEMKFIELSQGIILYQRKYATKMLKKFCMENYNIAVTPTKVNIPTSKNDGEEIDGTLYE